MLTQAEIDTVAESLMHESYEQFAQRIGAHKRIAIARLWDNGQGIPARLPCKASAQNEKHKADTGLAGQKRYTVLGFARETKQGEATC